VITRDPEEITTIVVGGGQAGLAVGYHLKEVGDPFLILDASKHPGESWRNRWDSLRLFTPARYSGLPGLPFPAEHPFALPSKDDVACYLEHYARRFDLPLRNEVSIDRIARDGNHYVVSSGPRSFSADNVVVATGAYSTPRIPGFAPQLDPRILQMHSSEYRNPEVLRPGNVLVVGAGNSGAEISYEISRSHATVLSGKESGHSPVATGGRWDRLLTPFIWFVFARVLSVENWFGRRARPKSIAISAAPLERIRPKELAAAGVGRVGRTVGVRDGRPLLDDGRVLDVANVIWCTGYRPNFDWIDLPVFGHDGLPVHDRGVIAGAPGLYFLGLFFQTSLTSSLIGGVGKDAAYIAKHIASRARSAGGARRDKHTDPEPKPIVI
jgi:putative flavoprotein involved in K+ transport